VFAQVLPKLLRDVEAVDLRVGRALHAAGILIRETACGVGGHDYLVKTADDRLFLRCVDCGHETPGWHVDVNANFRTKRSRRAGPPRP
jgi:hypothetical protein